MAERESIIQAVRSERRAVLIAVGALGVSAVMTQLALMRELLGAFAGNEMVLGVGLGLWLLLMGLGTWLGQTADRLPKPLAALAAAQIFIALIPPGQVFLLRALRNVVFVRGAEVGVSGTMLSAAVLLLPYCLLAGYALTLACSILNRRGDTSGAGGVYVVDSLGSIGGGVLFSFVLVRWLDHIALLAVPAEVNLGAAAWLAWSARPKLDGPEARSRSPRGWSQSLLVIAIAASAAVPLLMVFGKPDRISTALQLHDTILFHANSPYGRLVVTESSGQTNFIENGVAMVSTPNVEQVEEAAHYAMSQRPEARRVLLVSGGVAGVAKEILKYNVAEVDCVELDPRLIEIGRRYLPDHFADPRIRMMATDARHFVRQATHRYELVILALPDPSTAQLNRYFTTEFFGEVKRALSPGGVLSFSLGHYENYVSPELGRILASAWRSLKPWFRNGRTIPGSRIYFLLSDGPLFDDIAARLEQHQIKTKLVNRHYLDAMLTADRMADLTRATAQAATVNKDFSPVLYYFHLRHWLSQFKPGIGVVQTLLLILLGVYLARLRGPALVLFASGFAGSALEMVLLLTFQVLCGSVYHQVGVIVTVFMAGLALGARMTNPGLNGCRRGKEALIRGGWRLPAALRSRSPTAQGDAAQAGISDFGFFSRGGLASAATTIMSRDGKSLALLAFIIAGYAVLLPLLLPLLNWVKGAVASDFMVKAAMALLTLILAGLVGMQFPLANRIEFDGTVAGASRLYTADFAGAFLGSLLACTLLIPMLGVTGVCLLTAALNLLSGIMFPFRKAER